MTMVTLCWQHWTDDGRTDRRWQPMHIWTLTWASNQYYTSHTYHSHSCTQLLHFH